jgi:hypothetical protein
MTTFLRGTFAMKSAAFLLALINGYKTYASAILAIASGLGMILTKDYSGGVSEIFQALTLIFGGTSVVGLRHAVAKVSSSGEADLRHAVADKTSPSNTSRSPA